MAVGGEGCVVGSVSVGGGALVSAGFGVALGAAVGGSRVGSLVWVGLVVTVGVALGASVNVRRSGVVAAVRLIVGEGVD